MIAQSDFLDSIFEIMKQNEGKENLLHSVCLEFLNFIGQKKEFNSLAVALYQKHKQAIDDMDKNYVNWLRTNYDTASIEDPDFGKPDFETILNPESTVGAPKNEFFNEPEGDKEVKAAPVEESKSFEIDQKDDAETKSEPDLLIGQKRSAEEFEKETPLDARSSVRVKPDPETKEETPLNTDTS